MKDKFLDRLSLYAQWLLWKVGIAWHNPYRDECTPDFNCCMKKGRRKFMQFPNKYMLDELYKELN